MNFKLTSEELDLQQMYREFTDAEIRPIIHDVDQSGEFPRDLWNKMAETGLMGIIIPEEYGGSGSTYMSYALAVEETAKASGAVAQFVSGQNCNFCQPIYRYGTEDQKEKYLKPLAAGTKIGAFVLTEPGAGSDAGGMRSKAILNGDNYVLNGTKTFITGADVADIFIAFVLASTDGENFAPTAFIIEKGTPGLSIGKHEDKMGMRAAGLCEVIFEDCIIPKENILGKAGEGFHIAMSTLDAGRIGIAAVCTGMAQEAIDLAVKYTKERVQFGKRISQFQNTQFVLADLQTKVNAGRLMTYQAACALDNNEPANHLASMAKLFTSDVVNVAARACLQLFGGYGYISEYPIERIYRDAKVTEIFEGTSEIQKTVISKWMGVR
ncbi:MAG: acyl-CoA dehydrogenase family protein [Clostridiales bacterium]|nr:acyl-CoA dehydrogenase family protein [Clostridiales bacterium]